MTFRMEEGLRDAVVGRAAAENRSVGSLIEWFVKRGMAEDAGAPLAVWGSALNGAGGDLGMEPTSSESERAGSSPAAAPSVPLSVESLRRAGTAPRREFKPDFKK